MTAMRYNPLTYANELKKVGISDEQAEKFAQLQEEILTNIDTTSLATKNDLLMLRLELKDSLNSAMYKIIGLLAALQALFHFIK
jgi:hypothetical protein